PHFPRDVSNPALNASIPLLGCIVLRGFRQVSLSTRFSNGIDNSRTILGFQTLQLFFQQVRPMQGNRCVHVYVSTSGKPQRPQMAPEDPIPSVTSVVELLVCRISVRFYASLVNRRHVTRRDAPSPPPRLLHRQSW